MKRIFLIVIILCAGSLVHAQTNKTNWLVGGNIRLNTASNSTSFQLTPNAAYFVMDNWALGGQVGYNYNKLGESKSSTLSVGPFTRYYFGNITSTIRPFGQFDFNFLSNRVTSDSVSLTESGTSMFVGAGLAAFLSRNVALETSLGYQNVKVENTSSRGGVAFRIGFQVYIGKLQALVPEISKL